jgi:hypothetical protein
MIAFGRGDSALIEYDQHKISWIVYAKEAGVMNSALKAPQDLRVSQQSRVFSCG